MPVTTVRLEHCPPSLLFLPPGDHAGLPLVLFGHGAEQSKDDPIVQIIAKTLCRHVPAAVAVADAPWHGERVTVDLTEEQMRADWIAVEAAARAAHPAITGPTGYAGFSMGAMLGFGIVADLPTVVAAVFALGGLTHYELRNEAIRTGAARLGDREVLMLNMTRDEHFPMDGALAVFESIPGPKRMAVWAGTHVDLPPEAIDLAVQFFRRTLASPASSPARP